MHRPLARIFLAVAALVALAGCGATKMTIRTIPSGADVKLVNAKGEQKDKVVSDVDYAIENRKDFFLHGDQAQVFLVATKEGYKPAIEIAHIVQGQDNDDVDMINLEPLDTEISFETTPPGARIRFFAERGDALQFGGKGLAFLPKDFVVLPRGLTGEQVDALKRLLDLEKTENTELTAFGSEPQMVQHITTPFSERYTEKTVRANAFRNSYFIRIEKEDYLIEITEIDIRPGKSNTFSYQLKPFHTELNIVSEPDGVEVEDKRKGGFGYLGKTPLIRKFSYQEWLDKAVLKDGRMGLALTLKATKPGYEDEYKEVRIEQGETKAVRLSMRRQPTEVTFQSDPPEAHVYVLRVKQREVFMEEDPAKNQKQGIQVIDLQHWKHLGTTPFTYYMDPADPLKHDDELKFAKPGYNEGTDRYKSGVTNYHMVLEPKGYVEHQGIIQ